MGCEWMKRFENVNFNQEGKLSQVSFEGTKVRVYEGISEMKEFLFNLKIETYSTFRIVFGLSYFIERDMLSLSVIGEELIGDTWKKGNGVTIPSTGAICKWVENDFETIATCLLREVEKEYPHLTFSTGNTANEFVNVRIKEIQEKEVVLQK